MVGFRQHETVDLPLTLGRNYCDSIGCAGLQHQIRQNTLSEKLLGNVYKMSLTTELYIYIPVVVVNKLAN